MDTFEIAKLHLGERDILVVRVKGTISIEVANRVHDEMENVLKRSGLENSVVIIDDNISLEVACAPKSYKQGFDDALDAMQHEDDR